MSATDIGATDSMRRDIEVIHTAGRTVIVETVAGTIRGEITAVNSHGFTVAGWVGIEWRAVKAISSEPAVWRQCLGESWTEVRLSEEHNRTAIRLEFHGRSAPMNTETAREMAASLIAFADHLDGECPDA